MDSWKKEWGVKQWAAFVRELEIPVLSRTKLEMADLLAQPEETVSFRKIADLSLSDPFFALRLLRHAERVRSKRSLEHETTTLLGCVMQLGVRGVMDDIVNSSECPEIEGLLACERRATLAARIAWHWACFRADISPDEVCMAALLSNVGELVLWIVCPEMTVAVHEAMMAGRYSRNRDAQLDICGFAFADLSLALADSWNLPGVVKLLMKGSDNVRAQLARRAVETARHALSVAGEPALPDDVRLARILCPTANFNDLLKPLHLSEDSRAAVLASLSEGT